MTGNPGEANGVLIGRETRKKIFNFEDTGVRGRNKSAEIRDRLEGAKRVGEYDAVEDAVLFNVL